MAFTLTQVRPLLNAQELELFQASRRDALARLTERQLDAKVRRTRALRDKYRDLMQRQTVAARQRPAAQRATFGGENDRTQRKADVMAEVLTRFEDKLAKVSAAAAPRPAAKRPPAPGVPTRETVSARPSTRLRRPAKTEALGTDGGATPPVARPMRGATGTRERDVARRDAAASAQADLAVARRGAPLGDVKAAVRGAKRAAARAAVSDQRAAKRVDAPASDAPVSARSGDKSTTSARKRSAAAGDAAGAKKSTSARGVATPSLTKAVKGALKQKKQAAPGTEGPAAGRRRAAVASSNGSADPSLRAAPTDVPAAGERVHALKAKPLNKKIHAAARGHIARAQARRDGR